MRTPEVSSDCRRPLCNKRGFFDGYLINLFQKPGLLSLRLFIPHQFDDSMEKTLNVTYCLKTAWVNCLIRELFTYHMTAILLRELAVG